MEFTTRTVSVKEVFEAIKIDGFDHLREKWIDFKKIDDQVKPVGACIIGGAGINLNVAPSSDAVWENYNFPNMSEEEVDNLVIYDLEGALNQFEVTNKEYLIDDEKSSIVGLGLADALITLNDMEKYDDDGQNHQWKYSYEELVDIAEDIMTPHFDKIFEVTVVDFSDPTAWVA